MNKKQLFLYAFRKSIPVMLGFLFLGCAFGIVLESAGFGWPWALMTSGLIYAGSMQFALVPLLTSLAPLPTVALMTLMVNSRHLFYGLSFVDLFRSMGGKYPYMIFSLTDETYSVLCSCKDDAELAADNHQAAFYIAALHQLYWVLGSVVGAVAGELISFDTTGIDFSMTALFVVILTDQLRSGGREAKLCAGVGLSIALVFLFTLGADGFLLPTLACTVLALAIMICLKKGGAEHE
ncbi:MAG: AzlC family ABC transporter permease [Clostridia bacterium]|nr:AzlC family ABC transporter permease [Clostridia bacterium]